MKVGIIAEDDSDVDVMRELTLALLRPRHIGFKRFVGHGSGKLRRKCQAWARNLVQAGCPCVAVIHDLDRHDERELRAQLLAEIATCGARERVVLIPRREIEAWLLFDGNAIASTFNETRLPRLPGNPEDLPDPKKYLVDLVWRHYRKEYVNAIHNRVIASRINIALLRRALSFEPHPRFVAAVRALLR